jgi:glycosyltransferase involved in cell wall biosynthesis
MKKKVLFVITKSNWGGAQRYVFDLATHLPVEQFEVAVALGGNGLLAQKLRESCTLIYQSATLERDISFGKDMRSFFELYRLFKKEKPDIVHLNSSKAGGVGALAARLAGVPKIIFTAHGWPFREQRTQVVKTILWMASWLTALLSTKVICVSNYDLRQAKSMPFVGHKAVRIYNGIDTNMQFGDGGVIRNAFPPPADGQDPIHITGTVGELTKNKNQIALIEKARNNPKLFVAIVGEGEERAHLEEKIWKYNLGKRVKLFGFISASEVLKGFDTFALPSIKEGLPYVLLEAKAAGLPIVANPVGGTPEILNGKIEDFTLERMVKETTKLY